MESRFRFRRDRPLWHIHMCPRIQCLCHPLHMYTYVYADSAGAMAVSHLPSMSSILLDSKRIEMESRFHFRIARSLWHCLFVPHIESCLGHPLHLYKYACTDSGGAMVALHLPIMNSIMIASERLELESRFRFRIYRLHWHVFILHPIFHALATPYTYIYIYTHMYM